MSQGFHRQCQAFQEAIGPPWIQTSSGAGSAAEASAGSASQEWIGVPSAAVAVISSTRPGTSTGTPGVGIGRGSWSEVVVSRATASGGDVTVFRRA